MKGLKNKLKRPSTAAVASAGTKEHTWTRHDQRLWQSVAGNQPAKVAAKLSKHPDVDVNKIYPNVGYSVVHYSAAKGLDDCLNILLAHRADASASDITGATPLHAAARYGHRGTTAKLLASRSVKINQFDKNKCTALHFASFEGHVECVKLITEQLEADLHCTDKDGRTPLMVAAAMGQVEVCRILLERNSDVHHRDNGLGHTALMLAAESGHPDVVRLLCEYGAPISVALSNGQTALDLAKKKNRKNVIDAIHVAQLTEAANKTANGPRLSVSSGRYKLDETTQKKRRSVDSLLEKTQPTYIDDLVAGTHLSGSRTPKTRRTKEDKKPKSNIARVKAAVESKMKNNSSDKNSRRGSDASGLSAVSTPQQKIKGSARISPDSNTLSLYTAGNGTHFYDKEIKFYDTSLSNSSLDVSSTCSAAMNNISKSMDSLKPTPEEDDSAFENPHHDDYFETSQIDGTDFSRKSNAFEFQKLQKSNMNYESRIRDLETELKRATDVAAAKEVLNRNNEELALSKFEQLNDENEDYEKRNKTLLQKIEEMKEDIVNQQERMKKSEDELISAKQQILVIQELKEANLKQQDDCDRLHEENDALMKNVQKIEAENKEMREKIQIEAENKSMIINHAKKKINEAEQICAQEEQKASVAECNYELAKKENERMKKINEELLKKVEIVTKTSTSDKEMNDSNDFDLLQILRMLDEENKCESSETFEISRLRVQVEILIKKLKDGEEQIASAEASKKNMEGKQTKLTTSLDERSKEVTELKKRMKETEKELEQKTQDSNRLENELGNVKLKLQTVEVEKNSANDGLVTELALVRAELAKYEAEKISSSEKTTRMSSEIERLKRLLDEASETIERQRNTLIPRQIYDDDCEKLKEMTADAEKKMADTLAKYSQAQLEIANNEQEIAGLRAERNQSEARSSKLESEIEDAKSKCHESDVQVNMLRQQLTEIKHKYEKSTEEILNLRKSRRDLTLRLTTKQGEMSENERKKVDNLRRQLEHLCKHLQESERRYKETISVYRGHLLSAVEGQLDSDVTAALQEIIKLRKKEERGQGSHI